jgi:hypothetical protein
VKRVLLGLALLALAGAGLSAASSGSDRETALRAQTGALWQRYEGSPLAAKQRSLLPSVLRAPFGARRSLDQEYGDATGDAEAGLAPDLARLLVVNDADGNLGLGINYANRACAGAGDVVLVLLDADQNASTGNAGIEYVLIIDGTGQAFLAVKWNGSAFEPISIPSLSATCSDATTPTFNAFFFNRADLGIASGFNFVVGALYSPDGGTTVYADVAGPFSYQLGGSFTPPTAPPPATPPAPETPVETKGPSALVVDSFTTSPRTPHVGKRFSVGMRVSDDVGTAITKGAIVCAAKIGRSAQRPFSKGFSRGVAVCTWVMPASSLGKRLVGAITVGSTGLSITQRFSRTIAR